MAPRFEDIIVGDRLVVTYAYFSHQQHWIGEVLTVLEKNADSMRVRNETGTQLIIYCDTKMQFDYYEQPNPDETNLHVPGAKDDAGKPPVGLLFESFPRAFLEVAKVAGHGAEKYTRDGWRSVPDALNRYHDAACRHELKRFIEGEVDFDSGHYHLAHLAWNILALLEIRLNEDLDNR